MSLPAIIYIILMGGVLVYSIYEAGKHKSGIKLFATFLSNGIFTGLLIWGGFFN